MSHLKERAKKNCLNCNGWVQGRFCQTCGQENVETKESAWHLVTHFFKDITHFDSKFFSTLKYLFTRPGFLPAEYMIGRRVRYVNPVRMYVFTSAFFFLIFFSFTKIDEGLININFTINGRSFEQVKAMDSLKFAQFINELNEQDGQGQRSMTVEDVRKRYESDSVKTGASAFTKTGYNTKLAYDSALQSGAVKDVWLKRIIVYKQIELHNKYGKKGGNFITDYFNNLLHSLPQMLFVLLPFFALVLKLLYIRRKEYFYVDHSIFTIHFYIFSFLVMLLIFALSKLSGYLNSGAIPFIEFVMISGIYFYLYKAMRRFYKQRRAKTVFKFIILNLLILLAVMLLIAFYGIYSFYKL